MDCSPPDSSVHGISQARILDRVAMSFSRRSQPKNQTHISCLAGRTTREAHWNPEDTLILSATLPFWNFAEERMQAFYCLDPYHIPLSDYMCSVVRSCLTLCSHMYCSLAGSSAHGIIQARILEWGAISYSRGSSWPRNRTCVYCISCTGRLILYSSATWEAWLYNLSLFTRGWWAQVLRFSPTVFPFCLAKKLLFQNLGAYIPNI